MFYPPTLPLLLHNYEVWEEANQRINVKKKTYKYQENTPGEVSFTFITKHQQTGSSFIMWENMR